MAPNQCGSVSPLLSRWLAAGLIIVTALSPDADDSDEPVEIVYRVLRPEENPAIGIYPKNPSAGYTLTQFVNYGSTYDTKFIGTTRSLQKAMQRAAADGGRRIAEIDLRRIVGVYYDLSTEAGRLRYLNNPVARRFAADSEEVVIEGYVPPVAIRSVY